MDTKREQFPATSIGRSQGARLQHTTSHEAHPLLSGSVTSPTSPEQAHAGSPLSPNGGPRYVPYTPRQRSAQTAATTTTVHPPSPQHHQGDATSKLQLMNLKAAAQNIALDTGTVGWAILEKLLFDSEHTEEWTEVWNVVTSGKATLLLPLDQISSHDKISVDFIKDHIVLCDRPSRRNIQFVTLSGLRGTLNDETLVLRSTIHPTSKQFADLLSPSTRASALSLLPPLPTPISDLPTPLSYPRYILPSYAPSLPLPPRVHPPPKPPLPPRPTPRSISVSSTSSTASRIPNPFASLFGGNSKAPSTAAVQPAASSPPASIHSVDTAHSDTGSFVTDVPAFTIDRRIVRKDIGKEIDRTLRAEVKDSLAASAPNAPIPEWVVERVQEATTEWFPFIKAKAPSSTAKRLAKAVENSGVAVASKEGSGSNGSAYVVNPFAESPEDVAQRLQEFYECLEQDMRLGGTPFLPRWKKGTAEEDPEGQDEKQREEEKLFGEMRIRDVMEAVERTICACFYDRLFMQPTTDDASHDEALSSRVAALNMLDLGLEHLDIEVGEAGSELDAVVEACGEILTQLDKCRCPADKAAILVAAHRIVVDGLSRLPPIRLKSEEAEVKTPSRSPSAAKSEQESAEDANEDDLPTARPSAASFAQADSELELKSATVTTPPVPVEVPTAPGTLLAPSSVTPPPPTSPLLLVGGFDFSPELDPEILVKDDVKVLPSLLATKEKPAPLPLTPPSQSPAAPSPLSQPSSLPSAVSTPVSGDVLLPMIIFSVVKANPPHLVSHLLFTQRFRNQSVGGEESYCLINLMAVAEFLENVDLAALGLGDSERVLSTADLTPIPLARSPVTSDTPLAPADAASLRGRVEQQVDAIADSANKVISGVVDSSFGILRSFLPNNTPAAAIAPHVGADTTTSPSGEGVKPGFGLLRRESGFSIASIAASLPMGGRGKQGSTSGEESGQQLVTVSRPGSVRSRAGSVASGLKIKVEDDDGDEGTSETTDGTEDEGGEEDEDEDVDEEDEDEEELGVGDGKSIRSIRSFESMMNSSKGKKRKKNLRSDVPRKSLSDRLARMSALAGFKGSPPGKSLMLPPVADMPDSSDSTSPVRLRLAPPIQRFVDCTPDDLRLSEVGELLRDYRRLVEGIRAHGGFDE